MPTRCPYCGDRRTEVLKTVYRGHNSYRHRRCIYCGSRFSTQERPVRRSRVVRKWLGPRSSRNGWKKHRIAALQGRCEVESCGADFTQASVHRHVDHIVPLRLIRRLRASTACRFDQGQANSQSECAISLAAGTLQAHQRRGKWERTRMLACVPRNTC